MVKADVPIVFYAGGIALGDTLTSTTFDHHSPGSLSGAASVKEVMVAFNCTVH